MSFNQQVFDAHFTRNLARLARVEGMTKELVKNMANEVIVALHETGNIGYVNEMLRVLTPVNRRAMAEFGKEFTGFVYDEKAKEFASKSPKKVYAARKEAFDQFIAEPHNNIWTWSERNLKVEAKPFDLAKVTAFMKSALKKAADEDISQADVLRAVLQGGVEIDTLISVMQTMDGIELNVE